MAYSAAEVEEVLLCEAIGFDDVFEDHGGVVPDFAAGFAHVEEGFEVFAFGGDAFTGGS